MHKNEKASLYLVYHTPCTFFWNPFGMRSNFKHKLCVYNYLFWRAENGNQKSVPACSTMCILQFTKRPYMSLHPFFANPIFWLDPVV